MQRDGKFTYRRTDRLATKLLTIYVMAVAVLSVGVLLYTSFADMPSMRTDRDGVPHLSPPVINPDTGEPVDLSRLVRHFTGD